MDFKNYQSFREAIEECSIKMIEAESVKALDVPYGGYFREGENPFYSDGQIAYTITQISVELYTSKDDVDSEKQFENWLNENNISYHKFAREWDSKNKWYVTFYEFELMFDGE